MGNPEGMKFCGNCGRSLPAAAAAVVPGETRQRNCVECGRPISWDASVCMYCGHDYRPKVKPGTEGQLLTGAILTLLGGVLGVALLTVSISFGHMSTSTEILAIISYACGGLGVIGGYMALARTHFPIAVLGAACAIFTPAFFFAIPGLILVSGSPARFKDYQRPDMPPRM